MNLPELPRNPAALPAPSSQHGCWQAKASEGDPMATPEFMLDEPVQPDRMGWECRKSDGQDLRKSSAQKDFLSRLSWVGKVVFQEVWSWGHAHLIPGMVFLVGRPDGVEEPAGQVQILQEVKACDLATDLFGGPSFHTP